MKKFLVFLLIASPLTAWAQSACDPNADYHCATGSGSDPGPIFCPPFSPVEDNGRKILFNSGIKVNHCECASGQLSGCTNVGGLLINTVNDLILFKANYGAPLIITGGNETDDHHDTDYPFTHINGYKVDLVDADQTVNGLSMFITNNFFQIVGGCANNLGLNYGIPIFIGDPSGGPCFTLEPSPLHWDVAFPTGSSTNLQITLGGDGSGVVTSSIGGLLCGAVAGGTNCLGRFTRGLMVGLNATPIGQSLFAGWSGVDNASGNTAGVFMASSISVVANFVSNLPPPDGCGSGWTWVPASGNQPGMWTCPGPGGPPIGGGRRPPNGCWHWDPAAGQQGAWVSDICGGNPPISPNPPVTLTGTINVAGDPNDKQGAQGAGLAHFLSGNELLRYSVLFQNIPTASAPSRTVVITDPLNTSSLDLSTLKLGPISFGAHVFMPPPIELAAISNYTTNLDLRPTETLGLQVAISLDSNTGVLTWTFTSLDLSTELPPADPLAGFLAPGEEGSVSFNVAPKAGTASNTQLTNKATIVFNANAPMDTPVWSNVIDSTPPKSTVLALPAFELPAGFAVTWSGTDVGAGIRDFTIFVSDSGGPFTVWLKNTAARSATFIGQVGHTYGFYSIARDLVGNMEPTKSSAEATTQVVLATDTTPPMTTASVTPIANAAGWNNSNVTITLNSTDNEPGGTGVKQVTYSASGAQTIARTVVAGSLTRFTITAEGITTITFFGTDNADNIETARTITISIDKTAPTVACTASPNILWPPDNKLVPINVSVNLTDPLSGPAGFNLVSVTSSEPDSGLGDIQGFVTGTESTSGQLRAQRLGSGTGRVYTLTYSGADRAGNTAPCITTVTVPHDQGQQ
jgi:hypothetical protein